MKISRFLAANGHGRDFVMGDLHGCFDQLEMFMNFIGFNPLVDRMISVGDLIDRGHNNLECLRLLNFTWFYAVKGNHEELMQDYFRGGPNGRWWMRNGGDWWYDLKVADKKEVEELVTEKVNHLPLLITVADEFHVIHAELSSDYPMTDEDMANPDKFREVALEMGMDGASVIWGRNLFHDVMGKDARQISSVVRDHTNRSIFTKMFGPKLSTIYSGHTIVQMPTKIAGQINLDTCAFNTGKRPWCGLTLTEPKTGKFWKVTDDVNEIELVIV